MALIPRARLRSSLKTLPGWDLSGKAIRKRYTFRDFKEAIAFVNRVADLAERAAHHPDFTIRYNQVTLSLWTHSESGITRKDLALAKAIETIWKRSGGPRTT